MVEKCRPGQNAITTHTAAQQSGSANGGVPPPFEIDCESDGQAEVLLRDRNRGGSRVVTLDCPKTCCASAISGENKVLRECSAYVTRVLPGQRGLASLDSLAPLSPPSGYPRTEV